METNILVVEPPQTIRIDPKIGSSGITLAYDWVVHSSAGEFGIWQMSGSPRSTILLGHRSFSVPVSTPLFATTLAGAVLVISFLLILGYRRLKRV